MSVVRDRPLSHSRARTDVTLGALGPWLLSARGSAPEPVREVGLDNRARALLAVTSTVGIIKLSDELERATAGGEAHDAAVVMLAALAIAQWFALDATVPALALAGIVSIGGPLAELPFVSLHAWHYLSPDYFPIGGLGLASCTGPCYFAVTTDAIALGRWFASPPRIGDNDFLG